METPERTGKRKKFGKPKEKTKPLTPTKNKAYTKQLDTEYIQSLLENTKHPFTVLRKAGYILTSHFVERAYRPSITPTLVIDAISSGDVFWFVTKNYIITKYIKNEIVVIQRNEVFITTYRSYHGFDWTLFQGAECRNTFAFSRS